MIVHVVGVRTGEMLRGTLFFAAFALLGLFDRR